MVPRWCLYDKRRNTFHSALSYKEARAVVRVIGIEERLNWYAWKEGWAKWQVLSHVAELVVTATDIIQIIEMPPLPNKALSGQSKDTDTISGVRLVDEFTASGLEKNAAAASDEKDRSDTLEDDRKTDRIVGELGVEIICRGRKFRSVTRDISLKGLQLKDSVPEWMAGYCTLILSRKDKDVQIEQQLEFICSIVENQDLGKKFRLEIQPSKDSLHLKRWLLDLHIRSLRKPAG